MWRSNDINGTGFTKTTVYSVSVPLFPGLSGGGSVRPFFRIWTHRIKCRQYSRQYGFCLLKFLYEKALHSSVLVEWIRSFRGVTKYLWNFSLHHETHVSFFPHCVWLPYIPPQPHISSISTKKSMEISEGFSITSWYLPHLFSFPPLNQLTVKSHWVGAFISGGIWEYHSLCVSRYIWVTKVLDVRNIKVRMPHFRYLSINFQ